MKKLLLLLLILLSIFSYSQSSMNMNLLGTNVYPTTQGNDIYCEVAFKPVATIMQNQNTIDATGNKVEIKGKGRQDACVVPRAVPIVESMMALILVDHYLRSKINKL